MKLIRETYLKRAKYMVDLSCFEFDRDRVQYTTLEAMDYGCVPVFHNNYFGENLKDGENGVAVDNANEGEIALRMLEESPSLRESIIKNNYKFLKKRYGSKNTEKYLDIYRKAIV
jgi:glycosyltransferase involved in cell wall biosynthesis